MSLRISRNAVKGSAHLEEVRKLALLLWDENIQLQGIVNKLPKCWRLKDGKLVQDMPVVPGMVVFWTGPMDREIVRREVIGLAKDRSIPETAPTLWGLKFHDGGTGFACQCADTREAAEAKGE